MAPPSLVHSDTWPLVRRSDPVSLPWWTWLLPLPLFHLGTQLSIHFSIAPGSSTWYLPIPLGIFLVLVWGPRVLPAMYVNAACSAPLWGLERWELAPLYAWPEVFVVGCAWLLFRVWLRRDPALPDLRTARDAVIWAALVPIGIGSLLTQGQLLLLGDIAADEFFHIWATGAIGDLLGAAVVSLPALVWLAPLLNRIGLAPGQAAQVPPWHFDRGVLRWLLVLMLFVVVPLLALLVPFEDWWPVAGLAAVVAAIGHGLSPALLVACWIVAWVFLVPMAVDPTIAATWLDDDRRLAVLTGLLVVPVLALIAGRAVEDRRGTERRLRRNERYLRALIDALPDQVFRLDTDGHLDAESRHRLSDAERAAVVGILERMGLASSGETGATGGQTLEASWGEAPDLRWYEVRLVPFGEERVVVVRDTTERQRHEEQLRQSQRLDAVGRLAGGVAHDFNNMLAVMMSRAELLLTERSAGQVRNDAEAILRAGSRAADLARRMLLLARRQPLETGVHSFNGLVDNVLGLFRPTVPASIRVDGVCRAAPDRVRVDAGVVENALLNLCINARDAMPHGGELRVQTAVVDDRLRCTIADSGSGVAPEHLDRIFDPFFTTKGAGEGTGLGLATARAAIEQHGGSLTASSEPGQGTTFTVELPLCEAATAPVPAQTRPVPMGPMSFLVVEDEPMMRQVLVECLQAAGHRVEVVEHGRAALAALERAGAQVDLVLTDYQMPVLDGAGLVAAMRAAGHKQPVIVQSGNLDPEQQGQLETFGRIGFLGKPFAPDQLLALAQRLVGRSPAG